METIQPPVCTFLKTRNTILTTLRRCRYDEVHCAKRLGITAMRDAVKCMTAARDDAPLLEAANPLDVLIALFLFNRKVSQHLVLKLFSVQALSGLEKMHLLVIDRKFVSSKLLVFPYRDLYIVTDALDHPEHKNKVMALYPESYDLGRITIHRAVDRSLDLCTGSGVQALLASSYCREVIGIDNSQRAVSFATFNAWFNNITNVQFLCGDLYEPLDKATLYDSITANPPYNPELDSAAGENYHSGGESGEEVLSRIISGVPGSLTSSGYCHVFSLFIHRKTNSLEQRIRKWIGEEATMDVLILSKDVQYRHDILKGEPELTASDRALHKSWKRQKISKFSYGVINLRWTPRGRVPFFVSVPFDNHLKSTATSLEDSFEASSSRSRSTAPSRS